MTICDPSPLYFLTRSELELRLEHSGLIRIRQTNQLLVVIIVFQRLTRNLHPISKSTRYKMLAVNLCPDYDIYFPFGLESTYRSVLRRSETKTYRRKQENGIFSGSK